VGRVRVALVVVVAVAAIASAAGAGGAARGSAGRSLEAYSGLSAWISIYDKPLWRAPALTVGTLAAHGVHTLFLQTSNYRARRDIVDPDGVAAFLAAAHAANIDVVAWYLPSFAHPALDVRRALAAVEFEAGPESFDSFALDVESTVVRSPAVRNARALALAAAVRRAVPADYPLGAITIAPVGASPTYWPAFPFRGLSRLVDVFLPMAYFTARTRGAAGVAWYTAANVRAIRAQATAPAFPVHAIGGETPHATAAEVRAFVQASTACGVLGAGLWELQRTTAAEWAELAPVVSASAATAAAPAAGEPRATGC
jgi:hypothetical protein